MSLSVNGVNSANNVTNIRGINVSKPVSFKAKPQDLEADSVEISQKKELSTEDKQKIIKKARTKAAGWAMVGSVFSVLYYGLRSDKKIARKFDLDPEKDKKLIKQIKKEQTMWALPGMLPFLGSLAAYLIVNNLDSKNIEVD